MKKLIRIATIITCIAFVGISTSCSNASTTDDQQSQAENTHFKPEKELEKAPPMVMQQFGGCKAHQ